MPHHIERIAENFVVAEGPYWDGGTHSLYFVDLNKNSIHKYNTTTKKLTKAVMDAHVSFIIPVKDKKDKFIINREGNLQLIIWDGESDKISVVKTIETGIELNLNDAKCDARGRLWTGTLQFKDGVATEDAGSLYVIEKLRVTKVVDKITISNGLEFNPELKKFYFIDSGKKTVDEFDFDVEQGTAVNRHPIFSLEKHDIPGMPDGMTIDRDGNLWVAIFNGSRVIKIDPRKPETLLYSILLPAPQVTSVAFGGNNYDELYVTTACISFGTTETLSPPENGAVYRISGLGTSGHPAENYVA